jgi:hypothetical protein
VRGKTHTHTHTHRGERGEEKGARREGRGERGEDIGVSERVYEEPPHLICHLRAESKSLNNVFVSES